MVLSPATVPMISLTPLLSIDEAVAHAKPCRVCMMQILPEKAMPVMLSVMFEDMPMSLRELLGRM